VAVIQLIAVEEVTEHAKGPGRQEGFHRANDPASRRRIWRSDSVPAALIRDALSVAARLARG
jgi:hypothetical protein